MNKKISAIIIALLSTASITTVALAQKQNPFEILEVYPVPPERPYSSVMFAEGVAYDKESQESKQVMFLVMKYDDSKNIYLIIEEEVYKMTELGNETNYLGPGTKVFRYEAEDESILTVLVHRFERWGQVSISGDFKDYLITFRPIYYNNYPRPVYGGGVAIEIPTGVGKIEKEIRKEFIEETRPVQAGLRKIGKIEGFDIDELLQGSAEPLGEWVE